jgi:hypothetical protein
MATRKIEVFSAGCPLCKDIVEKVQQQACPSCEVTVVDMLDVQGAARATDLGVATIPAIAVNGKLADCCTGKGPNMDTLLEAGIGQPIS